MVKTQVYFETRARLFQAGYFILSKKLHQTHAGYSVTTVAGIRLVNYFIVIV